MSDGQVDVLGEARLSPRLATPRAAGIAGLVFAGCITAALLALTPSYGASDVELRVMVETGMSRTGAMVGLYLFPIAGIAFLWFIGVLRDRIGDHEDRFFASVFLGSGILYVAMLFAAGACVAALASAGGGEIQMASFVALRRLAYAFMFIYATRAAGVFMIVGSTILMRTKALPLWLAVLGYLVAVILLLGSSAFHLMSLLFPAWVATISVYVLVARRTV